MDNLILDTQYGFRRKKNTAQAIFIARRLTDRAEKQGQHLGMILLDWEKVFDKVDHTQLLIALKRVGIPISMLGLIAKGWNLEEGEKEVWNLEEEEEEEEEKE